MTPTPPYAGAANQRIPNVAVQTGQRVAARAIIGKSRTNLITNGTFEGNSTTGWATPSGFAGTLSVTSSYAVQGTRSLACTNSSGVSDDLGVRWD